MPQQLKPQSTTIIFLVFILCGLLGALIVWDPRLIVTPLVPSLAYALLVSPIFRLNFVTLGGILTLQGEGGIDVPKVAYLLGCLLCVSMATLNYARVGVNSRQRFLEPVLRWTWPWAFLMVVSLLVAVSNNIPIEDWLRGAIPYLLFACVPLIVFDVTKSHPGAREYRLVQLSFIIAALLTTISWAVSWISTRGYADLVVDRLFLWSFVMSTALVCYGIAAAYHSHSKRWLWLLMSVIVIAMFALTGTRQVILFAIAPLVIAFSGNTRSLQKSARFLAYLIPAVILGIVFILLLSESFNLDLSLVLDRFQSFDQITNQEEEGRSYQERLIQTSLARDAFTSNIWVGVSPGHTYEWATEYRTIRTSFNIDSPLALPANFGILGVLVALYTVWKLLEFRNSLRNANVNMPIEVDAISAFVFTLIIYVLAGSPFEDKGLSFAFMFLLSLAMMKYQISSPELEDGNLSGKTHE